MLAQGEPQDHYFFTCKGLRSLSTIASLAGLEVMKLEKAIKTISKWHVMTRIQDLNNQPLAFKP